MSVRMRHTRAHTGNRRSHHALKEPRLSTCQGCKQPMLRHRACTTCGKYRGKQVLDMDAVVAKQTRRAKAKA